MPHVTDDDDQPRRILASYSMDADGASEWLRGYLHTLAQSAAAALTAEGAEVVFVDAAHTDEDPAEMLKGVDGVLVLGGADLDPALYGQEPGDVGLYGVDPKADAFELALTRAALESDVPFLGICRGMQVLNVATGGTLVQDLGPGTMHSVESDNSTMTDHGVRVTPATLLDGIYTTDALTIRSGHHQAVDVVGEGLRVSATAGDGTIEAVEAVSGWTLGVQWHPEDPDADPTQLTTLMAAFARECAAAANRTQEN